MARQQKVLIVEDDQFMRELYEELLKEEGFEVETVVDGEKGLEMMKKGGYDLILLDIMLPRKSGLEVLKQLTPEERNSCGKIVLLTNLGQDAIIKEGFTLGADGYLIKSTLNPDQVLHEIRVFLEEE